MNTATNLETSTVTFADQNNKTKAIYYLLHSNASFTGVGVNTIIIKTSDYEILKTKGIEFA